MQSEVWVISTWPQVIGLAITSLLAPALSYYLANRKIKKESAKTEAKVETTAAVLAHKTAVNDVEAKAERHELKELVKENSAITADTATATADVKAWQRDMQRDIQSLAGKVDVLEEKLDTLLVNSAKWEIRK